MPDKSKGRIASVIIFFILLFVFAKWGPAINFSTTSQSKGEPFVVTGEGKVYAAPDMAKISVGITDTGSSLKTVQENVSKKSQALTDAIKDLGVKSEDIKTTSYNLSPQYDYTTSSFNRITGYQVSITYEIKIRDLDKINDIIAASTNMGANMQGSISFDLDDDTKKEKLQEARTEAVKEAKEKAESLSKAAGINLGRIINVAESENGNVPQPLYAAARDESLEKSITAPVIEVGENEISVTVSLSYETR